MPSVAKGFTKLGHYPHPGILAPGRHQVHIPDMDKPSKKLVVMGDRVLVKPQEGEERTSVGLYLPPTAVDRQAVQSGRIVAVGPGTPMAEPTALNEEPWRIAQTGTRFVPMQAEVDDFAIFFRKAAVEITFEGNSYLVVPQAAILVLIRSGDLPTDS